MIVVSLLLILVAVTLLVLGLAGGSSTLLISSIVASLLAAVALVVGARHAGAGRRAVGEPLPADTDDTLPATDAAYAGAPAHAGASHRGAAFQDPDQVYGGPAERAHPVPEFPDEADPDRIIREAFAGAAAGSTTAATDRNPESAPTGTDSTDSEPDRAAAYAAGQRDTEAGLTDPSRAAAGPGPDVTQRVEPDPGLPTEPALDGADAGADRAPYSGTDADRTAPGTGNRPGDDYDQASSLIGGARATDDESWRRAGALDREDQTGGAGAAGEFGEPDPDDPDDEPLPQKVRPADAVRVARLDAEVEVVDGRPRYHMGDCAHLNGRQTESLPVAEAVELGFSPCGLCRPVDRLVAASVR
ncbi:phage holin family protein [Actinoplanes sp. NPDC049548]|uniref:phage holin family protein n=1 Tax=Actinoplanes sp. NPDC049548 TaxID=3155152 RepID=UPI0034405C06